MTRTGELESAVLRKVMLKLSGLGAKIFRNNVGIAKHTYTDARGERREYRVEHGLCKGSSDLVGWMEVEIQPDMAGSTVAVFVAIEVKGARGNASSAQVRFLSAVQRAGGFGAIVRSAEEAEEELRAWRPVK